MYITFIYAYGIICCIQYLIIKYVYACCYGNVHQVALTRPVCLHCILHIYVRNAIRTYANT
jgi:hypothetical protein